MVVVAIGAVSHVSAHSLDNTTLCDGEDMESDGLPEVTRVGGDCDHVDGIESSNSASVDVVYPIGDASSDVGEDSGNAGETKVQTNDHANQKGVGSKTPVKAKITLKKLKTSYTAKKYFKIKVTDLKTKKAIANVKLLVKVYTKGKAKKIHLTTNSKGIAKFKTSGFDIGVHKVKVKEMSKWVNAKAKSSRIKVTKAPTTFLDEVGAVYIKKCGIYEIALFNKNTEKVIKGAKLTVKIYEGKKVHTYHVKTGKYGSQIDLSYLGLGNYKVVVKFDGNSKYKKCVGRDYIDVIRRCH